MRTTRIHEQASVPMDERADDIRIPVIEEALDVRKQVVDTGVLTVRSRVTERQETVELPLGREQFTVERVAVNRPVDAPVEVRQLGDVTIVPVHEEEVVVTRRLVLKEELHIRRHVHESLETRQVTLRRQDVDIQHGTPGGAGSGTPH
jgi:uncharacterized protein (TIGR02271 family)